MSRVVREVVVFCKGVPVVRARLRNTESPQFLSGWKEIGNYLGKGVRTVQRYERRSGLPVRRPAGNPSGGGVIATKAELDGWVKASPIRQAFRLKDLEPEYASPAQAINRGVSEMKRLREEMFELRNEVKSTLRTLQINIYELQGELNGLAWKESSPLYSENERDSLNRSTSELIAVAKKYPKAS
jgi:hypothetical protein